MKKITLPILLSIFTVSVIPSTLFGQENEKLIKDYISQHKIKDYKKSDLTNFIIDNVDNSKSLNGNVVKFLQTYNGFPIINGISTALIKNGKIVYLLDAFEKDYQFADNATPALNSKQAFEKIAQALDLKDSSKYTLLNFDNNTSFKNKQIAKQRLVYTKHSNNLVLCYEFIISEKNEAWNILINASNGEIIKKSSLVNYCHFNEAPYWNENIVSFPQNKEFYISDSPNFSILTADNATYNVFKLPIEAPNFGVRANVSNPWILSSSPEGWHSDGINHFTETNGNNVTALFSNSDFTTFTSPDGGSNRNFNFPFDDNASTDANMNAAVVNLFYTTNRVHDILYQFGFTETSRNFQKSNFGHGGLDNDNIGAIILPLPTNNASFVNHPDGTSGELSVQLWNEAAYLYYNSPGIAQNRHVRTRGGSQLNVTGITGDVVTTSVIDGCTPLPVGSLNNKIGLIKSGNCVDAIKAKNAQNAGALAAVIYEASNTENLTNISGSDSSITIPWVKILNSEGEYIKNLLSNSTPVNITLKNDPSLTKEKNLGFDNVVVIHEYVHGLSNRLTGAGYSCLDENISAEQMGEGWSDFYAMMFTNRPEYTVDTARGIGTYLVGEPSTGIGVRRAKYSTNFAVNNYTYGRTNGMESLSNGVLIPNEHAIGFVWATMLWDLHWKYAEKYGYSSNVTANTTNGSSRVLQLVTDALKLQACNPTFIDGRNAILAAELATTSGTDKCMIWNVFAKRGLGVNATAGSKTNINDQVEDFTVPTECNVLSTNDVKAVKNTISIYPNPAKNEFFINFPINTVSKVSLEIYDMSGKLVSSEDKISPSAEKSISTDKLINGTYMVKVKGLGFDATSKVIIKK